MVFFAFQELADILNTAAEKDRNIDPYKVEEILQASSCDILSTTEANTTGTEETVVGQCKIL